ncbi:AgmX/PglI C-terminal domain-containing protein [candidate division KSB1 bacterium]|nr:AgmX/PglI C-terminal domain-containing protein [candidate division KSB1 bacterium]
MNHTVINQADRNTIIQPEQQFEIHKFPREFKRNWLKSIDFRFLSIFCCTLILSVLIVRYLYFKNALYENVSSLKQAYVRFFDNRRFYESIESVLDQKSTTYESHTSDIDTRASQETGTARTNVITQSKSEINSGSHVTLLIKDSNNNAEGTSKKGFKSSIGPGNGSGNGMLLSSTSKDSSLLPSESLAENALSGSRNYHSIEPGSINQRVIRGSNGNGSNSEGAFGSLPVKEKSVGSSSNNGNFSQQGNRNNNIPSSGSSKRESTKRKFQEETPISRVIVANNQTIQECYRQALSRKPELKGKITIRFCVSSSGYVKEVKILKSSLDDRVFENCIIDKILEWKNFDVIANGSSEEIYYRQSFVFGK